ncbi:hypothetical protein CW749_16765 [Vibrio sp. vnigr-6D03]|nr:hypothetical protein CW749_16765 [Vibrio sp. vnigr-6D03]
MIHKLFNEKPKQKPRKIAALLNIAKCSKTEIRLFFCKFITVVMTLSKENKNQPIIKQSVKSLKRKIC